MRLVSQTISSFSKKLNHTQMSNLVQLNLTRINHIIGSHSNLIKNQCPPSSSQINSISPRKLSSTYSWKDSSTKNKSFFKARRFTLILVRLRKKTVPKTRLKSCPRSRTPHLKNYPFWVRIDTRNPMLIDFHKQLMLTLRWINQFLQKWPQIPVGQLWSQVQIWVKPNCTYQKENPSINLMKSEVLLLSIMSLVRENRIKYLQNLALCFWASTKR